MKIIFHDREGKVPATIQQQFEGLILRNYLNYRNDIDHERIDKEDLLYRLTFEPFIDTALIVIDIKKFECFYK